MKINIAGYRLLVRPDPVEEVSHGGIIIIASDRERRLEEIAQFTGRVISIGPIAWKAYDPDRNDKDWVKWCKVGDHIIYSKYNASFIKDPDDPKKELAMINDDAVMGVYGE